jgi:fumarate reductase subunit D
MTISCNLDKQVVFVGSRSTGTSPSPTNTKKKKGKGKTIAAIIVPIVLLILAALIGAAIGILLKKRNSKKRQASAAAASAAAYVRLYLVLLSTDLLGSMTDYPVGLLDRVRAHVVLHSCLTLQTLLNHACMSALHPGSRLWYSTLCCAHKTFQYTYFVCSSV